MGSWGRKKSIKRTFKVKIAHGEINYGCLQDLALRARVIDN